ncbi:MAG: hypothetical protein PHC28_15140 [Flavobacterium sp.]|uniref:hypothetical protein n=1 Tax=Flavobacterium sp. TaxID=239 RepID=UPI0026349363|nr:hypothetical protein [Flavobacterium sp.]MDD5151789.1 hypothetical protein [Flavobacterium sp.]
MADYLNKAEFSEELKKYIKIREQAKLDGRDIPVIPDIIAKYIVSIVENTANRYNFRRYTYLDIMISDGIYYCLKAMKNYDITNEKDNPFGYFSMICWRAFQQRIKKEKAEYEGKMSLMTDIDTISYSQQENDDVHVDTNETINWYYEH